MLRLTLIPVTAIVLCLATAGPVPAAAMVYWSDAGQDELARAQPTVGATVEQIRDLGSASTVATVALDAVARKLYWAERGSPYPSIWRADLDGSNPETVVDLAAAGYSGAQPYAIALDLQHQTIYWNDIGLDRVFRADYDGSGLAQLPNITLNVSYGLAFHPAQNKLYWTDWGDNAIYRADVDGTNIEMLLGPDISLDHVAGIDLDLANGWMYWANQNSHRIQGAAISDPGGTFTTIYTSISILPRDVAVDGLEGKIYWTDLSQDRIQRADLDGTDVETLQDRTGAILVGIALDPVPEPSSLAVWTSFGLAAAGLAWLRRRGTSG